MAAQDEPKSTTEVAEENQPQDISEDLQANEQIESTTEEAPAEESNLGDEEVIDDEPRGPNIFQKIWAKYKAKKKITIPLTIIVLLAVLFSVPTTRYVLAGTVIKRDVQVRIIDAETNVPVSGVDVVIRGVVAKTDGEGKATLAGVKVGKTKITATKAYYKDLTTDTTVTITKQAAAIEFKLEATGRQVPMQVKNKINGQVLAGAIIKAAGSEAQTNENGETTLVLPPDQQTVDGEITLDGYNKLAVKIRVDPFALKDNTFQIVPAGKLYFLSKRTGKIDVMKSDLDGKNAEVVVKATGKEDDRDTILLSTRDWKYLVLKSRRDSKNAKIYLIDTSNDKELIEIDGSDDASVSIHGWVDHDFIYTVDRHNAKEWESKRAALKSYNAQSRGITVIDESEAQGTKRRYAYEYISNVSLMKKEVFYTKLWENDTSIVKNKRNTFYSFTLGNGTKRTLKDFPVSLDYTYAYGYLSEPNEVYASYQSWDNAKDEYHTTYYEYQDGVFGEDKDMTSEKFEEAYPTYLISPSGNQTVWYEERDGNNTVFLGSADGDKGKEIGTLEDEFVPYGWFSDDYLLVSKKGSELYILPSGAVTAEPLKVTDYHRPSNRYYGYGGGYGGF